MKLLKKAVVVSIACYLLIIALMFGLQERLIFLPTQLPQDYAYSFNRPFDELYLETEDGATLNALRFKVANPKGIVLYFHGNAGDLSRWGEVTAYFDQFDYDVLVMDYRTYGKSTGALGENAMYKDASLFYAKAREWFAEDKIIVYGRSLGTTFATHVASTNSPKQLILESPFYSLEEVAQKRYWFLPIKPMLKYTFPTCEKIASVTCPITIFHGTKDAVVPYENGVMLQKVPQNTPCRLITITNGSHNDLLNFSDYQDEIKSLFR